MNGKVVKHNFNIHNNDGVTIVTGNNAQVVIGAKTQPAQSPPLPEKPKANLFISHRHAVSEDFAHLLYAELRPLIDGEIFVDVLSLGAGRFSPQLEATIARCDFFLLLISKGTFDGIHAPDDWVRWEIEIALREKRCIVPVLKGAIPFPLPSELPESIRAMAAFHGVHYYLENRANSTQQLLEVLIKSM